MIEINDNWIRFQILLPGSRENDLSFSRKILLSTLRFNRECVFNIQHESVCLTVCLQLNSHFSKKSNLENSANFLYEPQDLGYSIIDELSTQLRLEVNLPFEDELLNSFYEINPDKF